MDISRLHRALEGFDDETIPDTWPETLDLLEEFRDKGPWRSSYPSEKVFEGVTVLFIQHHLGPLVARLTAMCKEGMSIERAWFVDVPYSTNQKVRDHIAEHAPGQLAEPFNDPFEEYCSKQIGRVEEVVQSIIPTLSESGDRLLVIDDGAYFVRALNQLRHKKDDLGDLRERTYIVEQTTRGHRLLFPGREQDVECRRLLRELRAPVVSIARCRTKTEFEGPVIGAAVRKALLTRLGKLEHGIRLADLHRIGVIGFGPVGAAVFQQLREELPERTRIDVIDIDLNKHPEIEAAGGRPHVELPSDGDYQLLIGCTGHASFDVADRFRLGERATLVSCSSAAVEFNRAGFVEKARELPSKFEIEAVTPGPSGIRATISFKTKHQTINFLHAGFPINFDGKMEHIPDRFIQATHTLLFAAALQVLELAGPELTEIARKTDEWILEHAIDLL